MNDDYYDCDHDWTAYYCEWDGHNVVLEACNKCFCVNPKGLFVELEAIVRKKMEIEFTPESDSERIKRIDQRIEQLMYLIEELLEKWKRDDEK